MISALKVLCTTQRLKRQNVTVDKGSRDSALCNCPLMEICRLPSWNAKKETQILPLMGKERIKMDEHKHRWLWSTTSQFSDIYCNWPCKLQAQHKLQFVESRDWPTTCISHIIRHPLTKTCIKPFFKKINQFIKTVCLSFNVHVEVPLRKIVNHKSVPDLTKMYEWAKVPCKVLWSVFNVTVKV